METDVRTRFTALASGPEDRIDLAEASLLIAAEHCPNLEVAVVQRELDALAARLRQRAAGRRGRALLAVLIETLSRDMRFRGNTDDYYDPRNSFLNEVMERRVGIPITLSVLYLEVARRIDLPLLGLNFPGHFLVRYPGPERPVVLDVFAGAVEVSEEALRDRIRRSYPGIEDTDVDGLLARLLEGASRKDILVRMLTNLKVVFLQRQELPPAIAAIDRILLLSPEAASELRDRAGLYHRLECFTPALADYRRYLELRPEAPDAGTIRTIVVDLERLVAHVH
jgi:regulator of sirC expression with transglutaminase-like and TPR domain